MTFYTSELFYRLFYWVLCSVFCGYIIIQHLSLVIFIESVLFIKFGFNQVILINITDLFDLIWHICLKHSLYFSSIYFYYSLIYFFKPGWYFYQYFYIFRSFKSLLNISICSLLVFYGYILPLILKFLTQWDINYLGDLLHIEFKLSLLHYIIWSLCMKFFFIFIIQFLVWIFIQFYFLMELKILYKRLKKYKNQIFYGVLCFLYLLSPPDLYLQILILILNVGLTEALYFLICFIIKNINIY
nr:Sec-independent protein translocase component TatC [Hypnea brasiliensis]